MDPRVSFNKNSKVRRKRLTKIGFVIVLILIVILGAIIGFLRRKDFQISNVSVVGTQALDPAIVQKFANQYMIGNYAWVIPRTNELILSKSNVRAYVLNRMPGLDDASVSISHRTTLVITVTEKQPKYVWCATACFFVDQSGLIYDQSPTFSPGVFTTFQGQSANGTIVDPTDPLKERFATLVEFQNLESMITAIQSYPVRVLGVQLFGQIDPTDATYPDLTIGPDDVAIQIASVQNTIVDADAVIMVTDSETPDSITQSLGLLNNDASFTTQLAANPQNLEYIDFRFAGKIYYKFKTVVAASAAKGATKAKK